MSQFFKTIIETKNWLDMMDVEDYTINDDLVVDVDNGVYLRWCKLTYIPVQFGRVTGNFDCSNNQLISLQGSPKKINKSFDCSHNYLTSLLYAPSYVGGHFNCGSNNLTSLTYGPRIVKESFNCANNKLTSLTGAPSEVGWYFYNNNNFLTINESYKINYDNPGYQEKNLIKVTHNFIDKLETRNLNLNTILKILKSLEENKPQIYVELVKLVGLDDWITRLQNTETHSDIIDL